MRRLAIGVVVVSLCLTAVGDLKAQANEPPGICCVALSGDDSRCTERSYHRVTSMQEWVQIWQKHKTGEASREYDLYFDELGLPLVDFDGYMVIAIFQGSGWNNAGLKAVSITEEEDRVLFRFDNKTFQTAGPDGGGRKVTVYGFFVIPRSSKAVVLEENVQDILGDPPEWQERTRFEKL